ncbi:predicted protein [Histoplasma capsulatum H143]|uniref:Uncharacterized protein n=1 Tax=Ajellomyces capsulatus (strain H143) TaxID=544712 RepID=C6HJB7_AJECH|nr:predicted protein [Histoplasma capsulatum H143]
MYTVGSCTDAVNYRGVFPQVHFTEKCEITGGASMILEMRGLEVPDDLYMLGVPFSTLKACQGIQCGSGAVALDCGALLLLQGRRQTIFLPGFLLRQDIRAGRAVRRDRSLWSPSQGTTLKEATVLSHGLNCLIPSSPLIFQRVRCGPGQKLLQEVDLRWWHLKLSLQHLPSTLIIKHRPKPRQLAFNIDHCLLPAELPAQLQWHQCRILCARVEVDQVLPNTDGRLQLGVLFHGGSLGISQVTGSAPVDPSAHSSQHS